MLCSRVIRGVFSRAQVARDKAFHKRLAPRYMVAVTLAIVVLFSLTFGLTAVLNRATTLLGKGKITAIGIGIYQDSACTTPLTELNWGTLDPGSTGYSEAYIRNEGNVPVELSLSAVNWSPSNASSYLEFGWDYDNSVVGARDDNVLKVTFYLRVSSDVQGLAEFDFDINIYVTKV